VLDVNARRTSEPDSSSGDRVNFPQGTFFLFQHFPGIEFKKLGIAGTCVALQAATKLTIWLTLSLFIGAFSAAPAATEGEGLRGGTCGKRALRR
jgi:hypothetical protein